MKKREKSPKESSEEFLKNYRNDFLKIPEDFQNQLLKKYLKKTCFRNGYRNCPRDT